MQNCGKIEQLSLKLSEKIIQYGLRITLDGKFNLIIYRPFSVFLFAVYLTYLWSSYSQKVHLKLHTLINKKSIPPESYVVVASDLEDWHLVPIVFAS